MEHKNLKYDPNEADRLTDLAPVLASIEKAEPYSADQSYFDKLPDHILLKIKPHNPVSWFRPALLLKPKFAFTLAAAVVAIMIVLFIFDKPSSVADLSLTSYTLEDVLNENPEIIENIDESLLIETLFAGNEELTDDYFDFETQPTLTPDELDDFLSEEDLTPDTFTDY